MLRVTFLVCISMAIPAFGGERVFDFSKYPLNQTPAGFQSMLSGRGQPVEWKVIQEPGASSASGTTPSGGGTRVLAQLSQDGTDERFPMLVYDEESYGDFTLTTRFKIVDGLFEQMAGIAFRIQDTNNYYYVRASALGNTFRFIKLVNGQRLTTLGPSHPIEKGVWHELKVECRGNRINCLLNGQELIPPITDNTFTSGRIGFWTKSDSVSYFGETKISFTPHETLAQNIVKEAVRRYPRLVGLKVYSLHGQDKLPKVIASNHPDEIGQLGGRIEKEVIERDVTYYGKERKVVLVTMALHDRNGEVAGAVRLVMESFPGQTQQNALARAQPIVKEMELRIRTAKDLIH